MKIPKFDVGWLLLGLSVAGLVSLAGFLTVSALRPPPVKFDAIEILNSPVTPPQKLFVVAETVRHSESECTNGVQIDIRNNAGSILRLPVPAREVHGSFSRYSIVVPEETSPGPYDLKIRETSYCGGAPKIVESPWLAFEVGR